MVLTIVVFGITGVMFLKQVFLETAFPILLCVSGVFICVVYVYIFLSE